MSTDTTVRWFDARVAAAEASEAAGPFPGLRSLSAADEAECERAGDLGAAVQRASHRIAAEMPDDTENQGGSNG